MMQLSEEQKIPAYTDSKKTLVIAPAGAGKTRVLISRIEHLIKNKNVSPYEILSFSFTRKSANEIKERLKKQLGSTAINITCGTIHGCSLNYLQRFGEMVDLKPGKITIYSEWEADVLLKEVAKDMGWHDGHKWKVIKKGEIDRAFHVFYTTGQWMQDNEKCNELMKIFFDRCRENNALTYGMILISFLKIIPKISQYLNLCHVLVDEIQDLNPIQWEIVNHLSKKGSLFAIGDQRQAIYGFQGGDAEYISRNKHLFDIHNLKDNYRSSANIVEAANNLIGHNGGELGEPMEAIRGELDEIVHMVNMDSESIGSLICDYLMPEIIENTAILARNHWLLEKLSRLLTESNIKHEYVGKKTALTRSENFRRFHAFLKLIVNPFDNFSFLLIKDYLDLNQSEYSNIRLLSCVEFKGHFETWKALPDADTYTWQKWLKSSESGDFVTVIDWMHDIEFGFDTEPIFDFVYEWLFRNFDGTIDGYLTWLATYDVQDELKEESEGLQLMTVHGAKGLEWPTVIIAGLNEGIFPSKQSLSNNELQDERRLAYVAMTRAEDQLILTSRPLKKDDELLIENPVSRFVQEAIG